MRTTFVLLFLCFTLTSKANNYYFSNTLGDDSRSVSQAQNPSTPWKTISKLNSFFSNLNPGDAVFFKRDDTFYGSINVSKSGRSGQPIVIGAYDNGAKPIITGFQTINSWRSVGSNNYESPLEWYAGNNNKHDNKHEKDHTLNMVLVNSVLQPIGRFPKANLQSDSYFTIASHNSYKSITSNEINSIPNFEGGELVQRTMQWVFDRSIVKYQGSNSVSTDPMVSPDHPQNTYSSMDGHGFFFQNHINTLTNFGDWYYNTGTGKVSMNFRGNNPNSNIVEVSTIDNLVTIANAEYITIQDIQFRGSNENSILINASRYCKLNNIDISYAGINGVDVDRVYFFNTSNNEITNSSFNYINNNAINLVQSINWKIANNVITNIGTVAGMGQSGDGQYVAIFKPGSNSIIEYNKINNIGYSGIWFTGSNTIVRFNEVSNYCTIKSDGGGIYTNGVTGTNRLVYRNILHDGKGDRYGLATDLNNPFAHQVHGIYMDGNTTDVTISENTAFNNSQSGLWIGSNTNINVIGNTFYNNVVAQVKGIDNENILSGVNLKDNILFATNEEQLVLSLILRSNYYSSIGTFSNNYYSRPSSEKENITTFGYPNSPSLKNYAGGGIIEGFNNKFYSLDTWSSSSGLDYDSKKTPTRPFTANNIRFEYNATNSNKTIALSGSYYDVKNNSYNGSVTLAPFTSIILLKDVDNGKLDQTINFSTLPSRTFGDNSNNQLNASASSGLAVSYRIVSGPATVSQNTITITGPGTVIVEASQAGNDKYNTATPISQSFTVLPNTNTNKSNQTISNFSPLPNKYLGDAPYNPLSAFASSNLPVSFRIVSGPATISQNTITITGVGTVIVEASQAGNDMYNAATPIRQSFTVLPNTNTNKSNQTISFFSTLPNKYLGDAPYNPLSALASSNLPVSFRIVSGPATLNDNTITLTGTGTVVVEATQVGNESYNAANPVSQSFTVMPSSSSSTCSATGTILLEQWNNVFGINISDIPLTSNPSNTSQLSMLETKDTRSNFGERIRGYICPPISGNYTFYISGDDAVELWLSTNDNETNKVKIASSDYWTSFRQWNKYSSQKSISIYLQVGQKYYIEVLHKNGAGGDNVSVKWDMPNGSTEEPLSGSHLSPYLSNNSTQIAQVSTGLREAKTTSSNVVIESQKDTESNSSVIGKIVAYPNPFQTTATVQVYPFETGDAIFEMYDILGKPVKVFYKGSLELGIPKTFTLNRDGLSSGVYILRLITKTKVITQKITLTK